MYPGLNDADIRAIQLHADELRQEARALRPIMAARTPLDTRASAATVRTAILGLVAHLHLRHAFRHAS